MKIKLIFFIYLCLLQLWLCMGTPINSKIEKRSNENQMNGSSLSDQWKSSIEKAKKEIGLEAENRAKSYDIHTLVKGEFGKARLDKMKLFASTNPTLIATRANSRALTNLIGSKLRKSSTTTSQS